MYNGLPVVGATNSYLTIHAAELSDSGLYSVIVSNSNGSTSSRNALLTVTQTYGFWQSTHFTADEIANGQAACSADIIGDGMPNLLKYALGRDPKTGVGGTTPAVSFVPNSKRLQIVFQRDTRNSDLVYIVEASDDLLQWTPIAQSVFGATTRNLGGAYSVSEFGVTIITVVVQDGESAGDTPQRFLRLKVQNGAGSSGDLIIIEALYGANGIQNDVSSYIVANIVNGTVYLRVANDTLGGDPIYGVVKALYIHYKNAQGEFQANIPEGSYLTILDPTHQRIN